MDTPHPVCSGCNEVSPASTGTFTLIHTCGWRLELAQTGGQRTPMWHCPTCWRKLKSQRAAATKRIQAGTLTQRIAAILGPSARTKTGGP